MKIINRKHNFGLLILAALMLIASPDASSQRRGSKPQELVKPQAKVFNLRPDDVTAFVAKYGAASNENMTAVGNSVRGFYSPQDKLTWTVIAPREDDYVVTVLFSMVDQVNIEVSSGESVLSAPSLIRTWEHRPYFWRQELPGTLHLKAGENQISFRLPDAKPLTESEKEAISKVRKFGQAVQEDFHVYSVEVGTAAARQGQLERAMEIRGDASWMIDGKYGIFVHWSSLSRGFTGDEPRADWFQESVEMFDVQVFADAIESTGAAWVNFTSTHQGFYWPAPNAAVDKVSPGRTAKRDLLGEIIDELDSRGIRTLFYLHTGYNGYDPKVWREALGQNDPDPIRFSENIEAILKEASLRYGNKLMGFGYMDGSLSWDYPFNPSWESWARAVKAGNPDAIVGFSSNRGPMVSPFTELAVTDGADELRVVDPQLIGPGKQLGDVTNAWWCLMDRGGWYPNRPFNGQWGPGPRHSTEEYVEFFKQMDKAGIPVTINLIMTADVTADHPIFNPECIAVMEEVRKAVRGK
ncbi:MAG: alpha-L-fucosidase [Bacteroides sp.]|nr:alpha-L-fucosidase [Bacteroides sp.]